MGGKNKKSAESCGKTTESQSNKPVPSKDEPTLPCENKHWFGFRVVDDAGDVVKDVTAQVVLTDGSTSVVDLSTEVLEDDGTWRSPKTLDAEGDCTVSFPDLYNLEWWPKGGSAGTFTVAQKATVGDDTCALAVAEQLGFREYTSVWSRSGNKALRDKRPNANQLVKSDELLAPDQKDKRVKKATDQVWTFVVNTKKPAQLRIVLADKDGKGLRDKSWELLTPVKASGKTGPDGLIEFKDIPVTETAASLKVKMKEPPAPIVPAPVTPPVTPMPYPVDVVSVDFTDEAPSGGVADLFVEWTLAVGAVDSFNTANGVRARLHNLGFACDVDDDDDRCTRAVKAYQRYFLEKDDGSGVAADIESDIRDRHDQTK